MSGLKYLTVREYAARFHDDPDFIHYRISRGDLPAVKIRKAWRIPVGEEELPVPARKDPSPPSPPDKGSG